MPELESSLPLLSEGLVEEFQNQRNILITGPINSDLALKVMILLRHLDNESHDPIYLYINSPGGSVSAGLTIVDNMRLIKSPVHTVCFGLAASMGAVIFAAGEKGHRYVLPHAEVMIHQPWSSIADDLKQSDLEIMSSHMRRTRERLETILAEASGKTLEQMHEACEKDNWLNAEEAIAIGLADKILKK
ncbi:MAG: ATP-dependent Clp protease proteolytic subunit [Bacilli bacterium]|nr:ATP-dependent Clp protease proteolytic subunit [Bacilli bacterium]